MNEENWNKTAGAQSRGAEGGTNLSGGLAACPFCGEIPVHLGWPSVAFEITHSDGCWIGGSQIIRGSEDRKRWNKAANAQVTGASPAFMAKRPVD